MMTQEKFEEQIIHTQEYLINESYEDFSNKIFHKINVKGSVAKIIRLCVTYPELAKEYFDKQPKAVMD